jgi:anthranilate synthase component 2
MILVIDNYDSFTWNLVHYLQELGAPVQVERNDAISVAQAMAIGTNAILISPGPGSPDEAGISLDLIAAAAAAERPLLGVCLGHQAIGQHFGGRVGVSRQVMHGKTSAVSHDGTGVFSGLPTPFAAARYHSLCVEEAGLPPPLIPNAVSEDGTIMGLRHARFPIHGIQFHPESIASEHGHALLANFLSIVAARH